MFLVSGGHQGAKRSRGEARGDSGSRRSLKGEGRGLFLVSRGHQEGSEETKRESKGRLREQEVIERGGTRTFLVSRGHQEVIKSSSETVAPLRV